MQKINRATVAAMVAALITPLAAQAKRAAPWSASWITQAHCIHFYEAGRAAPNQTAAWSIGWHNRHNSESRGGMQFLYSTYARLIDRHRLSWQRSKAHPHGVARGGYPTDPADASKWQQLYAAWLLWSDDSGSWHEWSTAAGCGLR